MSTFAPFPIQPQLTTIALAYKNSKMIADEVLPRMPVNAQTFKYLKYALGDNFTIPNTLVGRTSQTNEVVRSATEETASTKDYALQEKIPAVDLENAPQGYDPLGLAVEQISELIALDREKRVADLVFNASNYKATTNKATLSSTTQWSHTDSDPIKAIMDALDGMGPLRANVMVIGRGAYSALIRNQKLLMALHGTTGAYGVVPKQFLQDLFELEDILVGEGYVNNAKRGQTASLARCWGKHCALVYRNKLATTSGGTSFGLTVQFGGKIAGSWEDKDIGMRGGTVVRVGESVKELILADDLGYLFTDAAA